MSIIKPGNNGPRNVLPFNPALLNTPNANESISAGPPNSGLQYYNPLSRDCYFPQGNGGPVGNLGFGILLTDDGLGSPVFEYTNSGVTTGLNGYQDTCLSFDGATGYSVTTGGFQLPASHTPPCSIASWIQVPNFTNYHVIIFLGVAVPDNQFQIYIGKTGDLPGQIVLDVAGGGTRAHSVTTIPTGQPVHIGCSVPTQQLSSAVMYLNGVAITPTLEGADQTISIATNNTAYINANPPGPTSYGAMQAFDFRYYTKGIGPGDMLDLYSAGLANRSSWWTMWNEMPVLPGVTTAVNRRTLSDLGTRTGSRQVHQQ